MKRWLTPPRALVISFAGVIVLGTFALQLPGVTQPGHELAWHEALFRSTSAICVTGLVVRPPSDFTTFGQVVTLVLFQMGGLGILTFGLFLLVLAGGRLSIFGRTLIESTLAEGPWEDFWPLLRATAAVTFVLEAAGAAALTVAWLPEMGLRRAVWWGVYHAVSAFCNAGFGLDSGSLMHWRGSLLVVGTVALLIVIGGLGFLPLADLIDRFRSHRRRSLTLHTKMVLATTAALLVVGCIGIAGFEWSASLAGLRPGERALAVFFQSVTPRTAGFNTLDYASFSSAGLLFTIMLMFIGASPGSTAGGVKTTSLGVLVAAVVSRGRRRSRVTAWNRTISNDAVASAATLFLAGTVLTLGVTLLILHVERLLATPVAHAGDFLKVLFETVSAFGTVGLSTGITANLAEPSRLLLVLLMFLGRVGPLTFGLALVESRASDDWQFPEESVMIG